MTAVKVTNPKGTKKCVVKRKLIFENYKNCLEAINLRINKISRKKNKINTDSLKRIIKNS